MSFFNRGKYTNGNYKKLDINIKTEVDLKGDIYSSSEVYIYVPEKRQKIKVFVPNSIKIGDIIRLRDAGLVDESGNKGNLIIEIKKINTLDVTIDREILDSEQTLELQVPHLKKDITVRIPPETKYKESFMLKFSGMGLSDSEGKTGDLYVNFENIKIKNINSGELRYETFSELNELVGLESVKRDVAKMVNLVKMQVRRESQGLKNIPISKHCVFSGNPGTGKTTVARILAGIYRELGVLSKGQLVEVSRADLVGGYIGHTALKTQEKIDEALGGVLFIDEAYTLVKEDSPRDFGQEAIDTILKAMEDHREDFIVIVAGYDELMKKFIDSNPGLKSRFSKNFHFDDYSEYELELIFVKLCEQYGYSLTQKAKRILHEKIVEKVKDKSKHFGNGREMRNMFEQVISNQADRLSNKTGEDISILVDVDFKNI